MTFHKPQRVFYHNLVAKTVDLLGWILSTPTFNTQIKMDISYYINNIKKYMYIYAKQPWYAIYSHTTGWALSVTKRLMITL